MALRGSLKRRLEEARLKKALADARKRQERKHKIAFETTQEKVEIEDLKDKARLQQLRRRTKSLQRKTGTGFQGMLARTESARRKIASRRPSFSPTASRQRLAAFEVAGLQAPARAKRVIKKRKSKRKKRPKQLVFTLR